MSILKFPRPIRAIIVSLIVTGVLPLSTMAETNSGPNILLNPNFENFIGVSPVHWLSEGRTGSATVDFICKRGGVAALEITNFNDSEYNRVLQSVPVDPNSDYVLKAWIKGSALDKAPNGVGGAIAVADTAGNVFAVNVCPPGYSDWREVRIPFNTGSRSSIKIYCYIHHASGKIWLDEMHLFKKLLNNGGMERLSGQIPDTWLTSGRSGSIVADSLEKFWGSSSIRITSLSTSEYNQAFQLLTVVPNTDYVFRIWAKGRDIAPSPEGFGGRSVITDQAGNAFASGPKLSGTFDWQELRIPFNSGPRSVIRVYNYLHHSTGSVWFDSAEINSNLLMNGSFEILDTSNRPALWSHSAASSEPGAITADFGERFAGNFSLEISHNNSTSYSHTSQQIPTESNSFYCLTGYSKAWNAFSTGWGPRIAVADDQGNVFASVNINTENWSKYELWINSENRDSLRIFQYLHQSSGSVWFDSMTLEARIPELRPLRLPFEIPRYTDSSGNLLVDGMPFIPVGFYDVNNEAGLGQMQGTSFNTAEISESYVTQSYLDAAFDIGIKVIIFIPDLDPQVVQVKANKWKHHPAVLAWYIVDEPNTRGIDREIVFSIYKAIKEVDVTRPVLTSITRGSDLAMYKDCVDILMTDPYPVPRRPLNVVYQFAAQGASIANQEGNRKACFTTLQSFAWPTDARPPTGDEVRAMAYLALTGGSRGLLCYSYGFAKTNPTMSLPNAYPELWDSLCTVASEMEEIDDILVLPSTERSTSKDGSIAFKIKHTSSKTYIIAVNSSPNTSEFEVDLPDVPTAISDRLNQSLNVTLTSSGFTEQLSPFTVRVYQVDY